MDHAAAHGRKFPHVIVRTYEGKARIPVSTGDQADGSGFYEFPEVAPLDGSGATSPEDRRGIVDAMRGEAASLRRTLCLVWSADACTFVTASGAEWESGTPPDGVADHDDFAGEGPPLRVEPTWSAPLPKRARHEFLCVMRHGDVVEVGPGERICVADFIGPPPTAGKGIPARLLDRRGRLVVPTTWRGVEATVVEHGRALLGPVQMVHRSAILIHDAWPDEIAAAAEKVAGTRLPPPLLEAVVAAAAPPRDRPGSVIGGRREVDDSERAEEQGEAE